MIPGPGDDLVFPASLQSNSSNNYGAGTTFNSLTLSGGHIILGNGISLNAGLSLANAQVLLNSITLNLDQTFDTPDAASGGMITSPINTNGKKLILDGEAGPLTITGVISGSGSLEKEGPGVAQLTANNSYTGSTRINRGTLLVFGAQPQTDVLAAGGDFNATLGGGGTVGAITASSNGTIAPGAAANGVGILNSAGSVTLVANQFAQLAIDIKGTTPGSGYDRLDVGAGGTLDLGANNFLDVTLGEGFVPAPGDTFLIVNNEGSNPVTGTFRFQPEGSTFTEDGTTFAISYKGGDGNDVTLHVPATRTWDGGGSDINWMTAANWVGDVAPQTGDSLVFPAGAARRANTNNFPAGTTFGTITLTGDGYSLNGNAINLNTRLTSSSPGTSGNAVGFAIAGSASVVVEDGSLRLSGANTYRGPTTVSDAPSSVTSNPILEITGVQPNSAVTIQAGCQLQGSGTTGPVVMVGGLLAPSTFGMTVTGDLTMTSNASFSPRIDSSSAQPLRVLGAVNLGNASANFGFISDGDLAVGNTLVLIANDGADPVGGTFRDKPEGHVSREVTGLILRLTYVGGDGNDIAVTRLEPPAISIDDVTIVESDTGTVAQFTATIANRPIDEPAAVSFRTVDGTALAGTDYTAASGRVTFPVGTDSATIGVTVTGDTANEPHETFTVQLLSPGGGAKIVDAEGLGTILNDDAGVNPIATPTPTPSPTPSSTPGPTATPTATPAFTPTVLGNIATRLRVETGNNVLIGGFIITGDQPKKLMLRAIGPSLPIADVLANPQLELFDSAGELVASNDNWQEAPNRQEIIDTTIPPTNDLESAILESLAPGAYTAIVSGVNGGTGVGVVEAYDLDRNVDSKLANIATRGVVKTENNVMIGGLIVLGDAAQNVLVRAIGPSLPIDGKLANPLLQLFDGDGNLLQSNDNWRSDQEAEITATTIPPTDDLESAVVRTLPPGAYTAVVSGVGGSTGVALVEVYALD